MAFYGFSGDADNCYWTPYTTAYNYDTASFPIQASDEFGESGYSYNDYSLTSQSELNYSVYTASDPQILQYEPYYYSHDYHGCFVNPPEVYYSNSKFLQHSPLVYDRGLHFPSETNFRISYSVSEFNEPEFEEYDPTPYGGGYDLAATYGKPLPPSDLICYPRSLPKSDDIPIGNFSHNSSPSRHGKDGDDLPEKPTNGSKPMDTTPETQAPVDGGGDAVGAGVVERAPPDDDTVESSDVIPGDDSHQKDFEYGTRGDYGYGCESRIDQIPYGAGLESIDICESIFGYWPCLAKMERQEMRAKCLEQDRVDPWKSAADYLFGTPATYGYGDYHHPQHEGYENSWLQ